MGNEIQPVYFYLKAEIHFQDFWIESRPAPLDAKKAISGFSFEYFYCDFMESRRGG